MSGKMVGVEFNNFYSIKGTILNSFKIMNLCLVYDKLKSFHFINHIYIPNNKT